MTPLLRKTTVTFSVLLMIAAGIGVYGYYGQSRPAETAAQLQKPSGVPVIAARIVRRDVPIYLRGVGTVSASKTVVVRSQIQGQLTQIAFVEGQAVKAGDLLAQIDPRPYKAQIEQFTANRDRDNAQLGNAITQLDRDNQLGDRGFATQQIIDNQKAMVAQLKAAVKSDQAQIDQAEVQLSYTRLTSPIPGITGIRQIDIGNVIHPTDTNGLVTVTQIEPISLVFALPEADLPQIQDEMAKGPLTVIAYSQDGKEKIEQGTLLLVDNQIAQGTGTVQLKAEFPNTAHRLWPGQLVTVKLLLTTRRDGLAVAASAVQQGQNGYYVYVVTADGKAQLRPVTVAQISQGQALIDSGVADGDTVVIDGQYRLKDGSPVRQLHGKAAQEADLQSSVQDALP